jgi:hypothetical protein
MGFWQSIWNNLSGKGLLGGNFQIRLIAQPLLGALLGVRFGIRDVKQGRVPVLKRIVEGRGGRGKVVAEAARNAVIPLVIAMLLDAVLQHMNNGRVRPLAAVVDGILLVFLPFLIVRALTNRFWTHRHGGAGRHAHA